jgi:hypothetical protein
MALVVCEYPENEGTCGHAYVYKCTVLEKGNFCLSDLKGSMTQKM